MQVETEEARSKRRRLEALVASTVRCGLGAAVNSPLGAQNHAATPHLLGTRLEMGLPQLFVISNTKNPTNLCSSRQRRNEGLGIVNVFLCQSRWAKCQDVLQRFEAFFKQYLAPKRTQ